MNRADVAAMIDHTLLAPEATPNDVRALCAEAVDLGVGAVCISPRWVGLAADSLAGTLIDIATVVGFPSGAHATATKEFEAGEAIDDGAQELDMVVSIGEIVGGNWGRIEADVAAVRAVAASPVVLKVIIESAVLDLDQIDRVCVAAVDAGADYVKTSTGFHPAGGATVDAVSAMRAAVGPHIGVKASGGIRDAATAAAMIDAGATRIGASASATILAGFTR